MQDIYENYIELFKEFAIPTLEKHGFSLAFNGITKDHDSVSIQIFKSPYFYIFSFSTSRLDYADGVFVYKSDRKKYSGKVILPKGRMLLEGNEYRYDGVNLEFEIKRLVADFLNL